LSRVLRARGDWALRRHRMPFGLVRGAQKFSK
jgi:hypothetical protein